MAKTNISFYYGPTSPILEVHNVKNHFKKQKITYSDGRSGTVDGGNTLVDSLNSVYNQYFIDNSVSLLGKPLNYCVCVYMENDSVVIKIGETDILAAFPAS
jgi:hypothetical protein